jgi:hypothetical protein
MRASNSKLNPLKIGLLTLVVVMSVSMGVFAQGRGKGNDRGLGVFGQGRGRGNDRGLGVLGQGRDRGENRGLGKKCGKFVNCHDARNGRWDGRGPRRGLSTARFYRRNRRDRVFSQNNQRNWRRRR